MAFEKVEANTWKPVEDNEEIIGVLVGIQKEVGANKSMLYNLEVEEKPISVWGSAVLDTKMLATKTGDKLKIVYLGKGEAKGGHNAPKLYDVYVDYDYREKTENTTVQPEAPATAAA